MKKAPDCGFKTEDLSRRRLFRLGAGAAALGALTALPGWAAAGSGDPVIDFVRADWGVGNAGPRFLVGYASLCGSTGEVASAIGEELATAGSVVEVRHLPEVRDLSGYDGFVIGSPIHAGNWIGEAAKFLVAHQARLARVPVAYFITCIALAENSEETRKLAGQYVRRPLFFAPLIRPVAFGTFAGKVDYALMPDRLKPVMRRIVPENIDARDWDRIRAWGHDVEETL